MKGEYMKNKQVTNYSETLTKLGIKYSILEHPQLISVEAVQKFLGYGMDDSAATLVMKADEKFVAIIRRGDTKLDSEKVKKYLHIKSLRMATEEEFTKVTGVPSGAASVLIPNVPTYIDKKIFNKEYINAGSGSLLVTIRYKSEDLKKIPGVKLVDICVFETNNQKIVTDTQGKRILAGITPSGDGTLHIGNYLGAVRQFIELAKQNECYLFVADYHAITTIQTQKQLQVNVENLILQELALLMGYLSKEEFERLTFFRQSDIGLHPELQTILNNITPLGLLKRAHAYKDKLQKDVNEEDINLGLFNYPILMAADILMYKPDLVPVGKDQKQHIEITRDIAERFNKTYKTKTFKLPDGYIPEEVAVIMGTDGKRKMSKSLGNIISIFDSEDVIKKQVNSTYTDPTRAHASDAGHIEGNMVFTYLDFFGDKKKVEELKALYKEGKVADVEVKEYLFESLMKTFTPARKRYEELKNNPKLVKEILEKGAVRARTIASKTMEEVRRVVGITNQYSIGVGPATPAGQRLSTAMAGRTLGTSINIDDFARVEMRVGKVEAAENVEKSEKLIRLHVDFGPSAGSGQVRDKRVIFTGVRGYGYTPEDFIGKQFFFVVNLQYRKMLGEESQGMIMAVDSSSSSEQASKPIFVSAENLPVGAKIR
jgi:tryptophanyl-tRNA synthetase